MSNQLSRVEEPSDEGQMHHSQQLLAECFVKHGLLPNAGDLAADGFTDIGSLVQLGWIKKSPGRYSTSYLPGEAIRVLLPGGGL